MKKKLIISYDNSRVKKWAAWTYNKDGACIELFKNGEFKRHTGINWDFGSKREILSLLSKDWVVYKTKASDVFKMNKRKKMNTVTLEPFGGKWSLWMTYYGYEVIDEEIYCFSFKREALSVLSKYGILYKEENII